MATKRDNPYGAFNFRVEFGDVAGGGPIDAGFSDVSGLGNEVNYSEYRSGTDKFNTVRKVFNTHKLDDVTLKRCLVGSDDLSAWIKTGRDGTAGGADLHRARQPGDGFNLHRVQRE